MSRKIAWLLLLLAVASPAIVSAKCVQVFYDEPSGRVGRVDNYGRHLALLLQNLLGHFPEVEQVVQPVQSYKKGGIGTCEAAIYISAYDGIDIPQSFLDDFAAANETEVAWVGYNVQSLGADRLKAIWNVRYRGEGALDSGSTGQSDAEPGYFKFYDYKGETFYKRGAWDQDHNYQVQADVTLLDLFDENKTRDEVVSWMRHSKTGERRPYVLHSNHRWLVADIPFSYVHEADRYLIFTDLLFDILGEKARLGGKHPAFVRFEDVHPATPDWQFKALVKAAVKSKVPFTVSVIPIYKNAAVPGPYDPPYKELKLSERPELAKLLRDARDQGGTLIMHGDTHQSDDFKNPTGPSGVDYEFWNVVANTPMASDSAAFVVGRLEQGVTELEKNGIKPAAWLTPHYAASPLDNYIFAQLFEWNIGRVMYAPVIFHQRLKLPANLDFDNSGSEKNGKRLPYFSDLKATLAGSSQPEGQFFPYEIYRDAYGQHLIPENLGYIRPVAQGPDEPVNTVDDILTMMRRNRILRDAWGSFYMHPYMTDTAANGGIAGAAAGDTTEIERLYETAKELGYEFVDLGDYIAGKR